MNTSKKDIIIRELSSAIRNCNRNIYEWIVRHKRGSRYTISHTEIRGLVKNWIIRNLKDTLGKIEADKVLREGNLYVSVDEENNCIAHISLSSTDEYRMAYKDIELIKECMKMIKYNTLRYDPADYKQDGIDPIIYHYNNPNNIDLNSIENVKF